MAIKKVGGALIAVGLAGAAISLLVVFLFGQVVNLRPIGILGIEISAALLLLGFWLKNADSLEGFHWQKLIEEILHLPVVLWVLIGFLIVYLFLFLTPVFLNPALQMNYFTGYIPNLNPIGNDLIVLLDQIKGWVTGNQSPYTVQFYPPLTYILFTPLLLIKDYLTLYRSFTLFTLISYCLLTLWLPLKIIGRQNLPLALLLFITGLFSYGFQFEVERGQYNVFTFLLCLSSIYIFHYHPKYRLLAYILFSLSVQLKLYPAIFIVMLVDDWRDWKNILRRFAGIGLLNLALLFVMGYQIFWEFIHSVTAQVVNPSWIGPWNHSISSFVSTFKQDGLGLVSLETLRVLRHNSGWIEAVLFLLFLLLFISALVIAYRRNEGRLDPYLLLACTIGAMVLPISYDYKLSILTVPMLLFLCSIPEMNNIGLKFFSILLILGISIAYFAALIPSNYRPHILINIFPSLLLILILATILNFMRSRKSKFQIMAAKAV